MREVVQTKPHHFLDIIKVFGAGGKFVPSSYGHAVHTVAEKVLGNRDVVLQLILGCDDICRPCVHNKEGKCVDGVNHPPFTSKEEYNKAIDSRIFELWRLKEGTEIAASEFCRLAQKNIETLYEIWRDVPRKDTDLRKEDLMKGISMYLTEGS